MPGDIVSAVNAQAIQALKFPEFSIGDDLSVAVRVKEGNKTRVQTFKGVCIKKSGAGAGRNFTVRKFSSGVGVERTFPFLSPFIDSIQLGNRAKVRRARLFYLRKLRGRAARLKSK